MKKEIKPLNFKVDAKSAVPVYEQVKQAVKLFIISGYLKEGDQIMSIRDLAANIKIHPNTIAKVFYQLEVEGYVSTQPGSGCFVKMDKRKIGREKWELFEKTIDEAVSKILQLGYSMQEMVEELQKRIREKNPGNNDLDNNTPGGQSC
jgi:GntR family transcriptional regulator